MPRDANGIYSLPDGYLAETGATIQASQHNPPLEDLATSMTASLPRSGSAPMTGPLRVLDGSSNAPSICFATDPSVGFYKKNNTIVSTRPLTGSIPIGLGPLPWSRLTVPAGWVFCFGQTLSRVTYADLWAIAQVEIAAGNTFFNNGNGVDTFGIGDMRGRITAGKDDMGGTAAGRLTATYFGSDAKVLGIANGSESVGMILENLIQHDHSAFLHDDGHDHALPTNVAVTNGGNGAFDGPFRGNNVGARTNSAKTGITLWSDGDGTGTQNKVGKTGSATPTPMRTVQPTLITNFILYAGA